MNRVLLAGLAGVVAGVAIAACTVDREGAPCDTDDNCPRSQYCDLTNKCVELKPSLDAPTACQLVMVSVSQKYSACAGGSVKDWHEEILPDSICGTYNAGVTASRLGYAPMKLKQCRASVLSMQCADLATRKAGQVLAECEMYSGTAASAGACSTDKDCTSGYCDTTIGCPGACRAFVSENVACTGTDVCQPGTACTNGTCKRYITSGPCSADAGQCQPYANYCSGGQCVPRQPAGTANCDPTNSYCQSNLNCVGAFLATKICQQGAALDAVCSPFTGACDKFTYCQQRDGGNFCTELPGPGGGCGLAPPNGAQDLILYCKGSRCNGVSCVNYLALGAGCSDNTSCGPLARCVAGVCRAEFCP